MQVGPGPGSVQTYWIIRNSKFHNIKGSSDIAFLGGCTNQYIDIYNNIFWNDNQTTYNLSPGVIWTKGSGTGSSTSDLRIYNNTFYNISLNQIALSSDTYANNEVQNNLFHTGNFTSGNLGVAIAAHNDYYANTGAGVPVGETGQQNESSDPCVNVAAGDFTLRTWAKANSNGADMSAVFTTDILGVSRLVWDIGAYVFTSPPVQMNGLSGGSLPLSNFGSGSVQITLH